MSPRRLSGRSMSITAVVLICLLGLAYLAVRSHSAAETNTLDAKAPFLAEKVDPAKIVDQGPLQDVILGEAGAPVTIIEYASMTCPHCAHFNLTTLPALKRKYIDTGKAKFVLREFSSDPLSTAAFMLARCMPVDRFYLWMGIMFRQQQALVMSSNPKEYLWQTSKFAGMTQRSFVACLSNQSLLESMNAARDRASKSLGVEGTPTFFINGSRYVGALSIDEISAIIDRLL
jgi:protein-disulfide isomerase